MRLITSETQMTWVLNQYSLTQCDFDYAPDLPFVTSEPLQMLLYTADDFYIGRACLSDGTQSECSASESHSERLCCCLGPGEDIEVVCQVPTTTTTTVTRTTSTSTSATLTTSTSTSVTDTSTSISSTSTSTSTLSTTSQTTTSRTSTSSTQTTTSFISTSSTFTTESTTSSTFTTRTSTTATFTTTTMTTTTGMTTELLFEIFAGGTVLIVSTNAGFSVGDMIKIARASQPNRFYEYVEITAFGTTTISSRRLATYTTFTISPPLQNRYGPGASIQNFGPAASFTGGDPVTYFGGNKWKFWLPLREELLLLATPDLRLYGSVFPGPQYDQQWFDYFMVTFPDDVPIATVRVKPPSNRSLAASRRCSSGRFEMLDITLGQSNKPLKEMRKMEYTAKSVRFEVNCRNQ
ncbi:unnamed protein product, partial [Symbiodinium pilosum]